jgi:hypothetical protein
LLSAFEAEVLDKVRNACFSLSLISGADTNKDADRY